MHLFLLSVAVRRKKQHDIDLEEGEREKDDVVETSELRAVHVDATDALPKVEKDDVLRNMRKHGALHLREGDGRVVENAGHFSEEGLERMDELVRGSEGRCRRSSVGLVFGI